MTATRAEPPVRQRSALSLSGFLAAGTLLLCLATGTGFLGEVWWVFELTSHFKVQLAVLLLTAATLRLIRKRWWLGAVCGAFGLINTGSVLLQLIPNAAPAFPNGPTVRLVGVNVLRSNLEGGKVVQFLREAEPDLILLMEVNPRWMRELEPLYADYPHRLSSPRTDNFGIALLSRLPLSRGEIIHLGAAGVPSVAADILLEESSFHLLGTHPVPPASSRYARLRNDQLAQVSAHVRNQPSPVTVLGDLNTTPWSPYFKSLLEGSQLKDTTRGRGIQASWPAEHPLMRIPLDHCLVSPSIHVKRRSLGPSVGGDHLPVVVELVIPVDTRPDEPAGGNE